MACEALLRAQVNREPDFLHLVNAPQHSTRSKVKKRLRDKML
jgi:hypothetical protein